MHNVLSKVKKEDISRDPFPHVYIKDVYPEDFCAELIDSFPDAKHIAKDLADQNNKRISYNAKAVREDDQINPVWKDLIERHVSQEFYDDIVRLFRDDVYALYPDFKERFGVLEDLRVGVRHIDTFETADILLDAQICINTAVSETSSVKIAHVDNENKLFTGLFYLRLPEDDLENPGDLLLYKYKDENNIQFHGPRLIDDKYVEEVGTIPYEKNTLIFFPDSLYTLHGVKERDQTDIPRCFMNLIAEVDDKLFDLEPYRKKGLKSRLKQFIIGTYGK